MVTSDQLILCGACQLSLMQPACNWSKTEQPVSQFAGLLPPEQIALVCDLTSLVTLELNITEWYHPEAVKMVLADVIELCRLQMLNVKSISPEVAELPALQVLDVDFVSDSPAFTQITSLTMRGCNIRDSLPLGAGVELHSDMHYPQAVTALTSLCMLPVHVHELRWPNSLQKLQKLVFSDFLAEACARSSLDN